MSKEKSVLEIFDCVKNTIKENEFWDFGNDVLYKMCERNPKHTDIGVVIGKMWLIGRSYAASLERTKEGSKGDSFYECSLAKIISEKDLDSVISGIENIETAISAHNELINLFKGITGKENRSFFSKYLHFHYRETVYIYDERARKAINNIIKELKDSGQIKGTEKLINCAGDKDYKSFCEKVVTLQKFLKKEKKIKEFLTPREIDNFLLYYCKEKEL